MSRMASPSLGLKSSTGICLLRDWTGGHARHPSQRHRGGTGSKKSAMHLTFELARYWMRGEAHNRWLIAALGIAGWMAPWRAWTHKRSAWNVKSDVVGSC